LKILVACEFSGVVRDAFLKKGHDAVSCDLLPSESNHPEDSWRHIQGDVLREFKSHHWDLMVAHPPCTYLAICGNRSFKNNPHRWKKRYQAMVFVYDLMNANIEKICIENPKSVISSYVRKPDQCIQPYEFGHPERKTICLWLKNLPLLKPTKIVEPKDIIYNSKKTKSGKSRYSNLWNGSYSGKERSVTFRGIAEAMASQWGDS